MRLVEETDVLIRPSVETPYDDLKNAILRRLQPPKRDEAVAPTAGSFSVITTSSDAVFIPTSGCSNEKQPSFPQGSNSSLRLD